MNGIHDMGGMDGFGPVERDEAQFHAEWEKRAFALANLALVRAGANVDEFRHAIERIPPARYLASSYYERWMIAIETLLVEKGILDRAAIDRIAQSSGVVEPAPCIPAEYKPRSRSLRARLAAGDMVRARVIDPMGHTRLVGYARGRSGVILADRGVYVFPDTNAHRAGENRQHVYSVEFRARELFGDRASPRDRVVIDLWEDYLEPDSRDAPGRRVSARAARAQRAKSAARKRGARR